MPTTQFLPFGIETNALVLDEKTYGAETWLNNGFGPGIADPVSCNTAWRQASFVAAGITQWLANILNKNINDDGNLTNFVTLFSSAIKAGTLGGVTSFNTRTGAVVISSTDITNALGYTPVQSINGRGGAVILQSSDVTGALGYIPVNKSGDTMTGLLSGPNPVSAQNYATKSYVDNAVGSNGTIGGIGSGITGNSSEYTFPLGDGGYIKVGAYFPSGGIANGTQTWVYNFATPFPTTCVTVNASFIAPVGSLCNAWGISIYTNTSTLSNAVTKTGFVMGISSPGFYGYFNNGDGIPNGINWYAIGY